MESTKLDERRAALLALKAELEGLAETNAQDRRVVELDQQSVGRLSRMDALQGQAMAQETMRRRALDLKRIEAALARIEEDEYGWCARCGEEIAEARLDLDPMAAVCAGCAR